MEDIVTLSKSEYESLLDDANWRRCLENGGVDNWEWYHESLKANGYFDEEEAE